MNKFRRTAAAAAASLAVVFAFPAHADVKQDTVEGGLSAVMARLRTAGEGAAEVGGAWSAFRGGDVKAIPVLIELAKGGNAVAQLYVGYMLDNGDGLKQDAKSAAAYFSAAAPKVALAKYNLGLMHLQGRGVAKDEKRAMQLFEGAISEAGIEQAAVRLAQFHLAGGRAEEAKKWANKGAELGNPVAFHVLGRIAYDRGEFRDARTWLEKAAAAGDKNSPRYLARIYVDRLGNESSRVVAAGWAIIDDVLSRRSTSTDTASPQRGLGNMSEDEVLRSRSFAREWLKERGGAQPIQYGKTIYQVRGWQR